MMRLYPSATRRCFAALVALLCLAAAARAAAPEQRTRMSEEMTRLDAAFDDVRKELAEDHAALAEERDDHCNAIFERVKELRQERDAALAQYNNDYRDAEQRLTSQNLDRSNPQYTAAMEPLTRRRNAIISSYENSLDALQQLYVLNDRRYNEMLRILSAREQLEDQRHRDERERIAQRARFENRDDNTPMSEAERDRLRFQQEMYAEMQDEAEARYQGYLNALDEYRDLVDARIKAQADYLEEYGRITAALPRASVDDSADYTRQMAELNARKDAEERRYQNDVRFIEERLTLEQLRNRELTKLAEERRALELARNAEVRRFEQRRLDMEAMVAGAGMTDQERARYNEQFNQFNERRQREDANYQAAADVLQRRQALLDQAFTNRMAYLRDRNDLRVRMAENQANNESFDEFRDEISRLEERRINEERQIREELFRLGDAMPAGYAVNPWQSGDPEQRRSRMTNRLARMEKRVAKQWDDQEKRFQANIRVLDERLKASDLSDADREMYQGMRNDMNAKYTEAKAKYDESLKSIEERKGMEEARIASRKQYLEERKNILEEVKNANTVDYRSTTALEQKLRDLDTRFVKEEREYRDKMKPLGRLLPSPDESWRERSRAGWRRGLERIDHNVRTDGARTGVRRTNATDDDGFVEDVRDAARRAKDKVVETYHDAVDYLRD